MALHNANLTAEAPKENWYPFLLVCPLQGFVSTGNPSSVFLVSDFCETGTQHLASVILFTSQMQSEHPLPARF